MATPDSGEIEVAQEELRDDDDTCDLTNTEELVSMYALTGSM